MHRWTAIHAADLDAITFQHDVFMRNRFAFVAGLRLFGGINAGVLGDNRLFTFEQMLDGIKLGGAFAAAHLSMRSTQDRAGNTKYGLAIGAFGEHA
jgi:hypothetical protein